MNLQKSVLDKGKEMSGDDPVDLQHERWKFPTKIVTIHRTQINFPFHGGVPTTFFAPFSPFAPTQFAQSSQSSHPVQFLQSWQSVQPTQFEHPWQFLHMTQLWFPSSCRSLLVEGAAAVAVVESFCRRYMGGDGDDADDDDDVVDR